MGSIWLLPFLMKLGYTQQTFTPVKVDNQSTIRLVHNQAFHNSSKNIDVRFRFTRLLVEEKEIEVPCVPTAKQAADILTKPLMKEMHMHMKKILGLIGFRLLFMLIFLCLLCEVIRLIQAITTKIPGGSHQVHLPFQLVSPYEMLSNETLHVDIEIKAQIACRKIYDDSFLEATGKICPVKQKTELICKQGVI